MDIKNNSTPIPLNNLKRRAPSDNKKYIPDDIKKVAANQESLFAKFMIDQMNKSIQRSENNQATNIYRDLLTTERAKMLSDTNGGLGLQDVILDQLYPKKFRNKINYEAYQKMVEARSKIAHNVRNQRADIDSIGIENTTVSAKEHSNE